MFSTSLSVLIQLYKIFNRIVNVRTVNDRTELQMP